MLLHFTRWETASLRRCLRILIECLLIITSFPLTLERPWSWLGLVLLEINLEKGMGWCDQTDSGKFVQAEGWILVNREDATLGGRDVEANFVGRHPETKEGIFFFFVDFYQGFAFLAMEACCISAWSQQTMTAGLFKHLAVCLIVLLFPISYTRSLLMLPEAICYTRTWGSPFCWCGNEARSSAEAGTALLCHCEPEQRSRVCTLLLKHFQHIWSEPMDQIAEAGVRQAEPPIYDPQISVGSVRLTKTVWRSAYRGLNSGRNGIQFLCTSAVIVNDDFFFFELCPKFISKTNFSQIAHIDFSTE